MRESTKNALRAVQKLTHKLCVGCKTNEPYRCCDIQFCQAVDQGLKAIGKTISHTGHPTLLFMGNSGCIVPAEYRPGCSGFVCKGRLETRQLRREYQRLHDKFMEDPEVFIMMKAAVDHVTKFKNFKDKL